MKIAAREICLIAALTALALAISVAESWLPASFIPIPGVKLGLANIVTLFALYFLSLPRAATVLALRCVLGSLFGGGVTALAFSLTGGLLALLVMWLLLRTKKFSLAGVSIAGAAAHGVGQILAAMALLATPSVFFYLPALLLSAIFTGALTGILAYALIHRLARVPQIANFLSQRV